MRFKPLFYIQLQKTAGNRKYTAKFDREGIVLTAIERKACTTFHKTAAAYRRNKIFLPLQEPL